MLKLFLMFTLAGLSLVTLHRAARAQAFAGTYTISSPHGALTLTLHAAADDALQGTLVGFDGTTYGVQGTLTLDEDDEPAVEGAFANAQGSAAFVLYADDEAGGYHFLVMPHDASGTPQAFEYSAQRREAGATVQVTPTETHAADGTRDGRLVGLWATQVIMNTPGGSVATQLFMEIRADGALIDRGSRSMGSFADAGLDTGLGGGQGAAAWRTQGNVVYVSYGGSPWVPFAQFEVSGNRLLLVYLQDGSRQLWYRQ